MSVAGTYDLDRTSFFCTPFVALRAALNHARSRRERNETTTTKKWDFRCFWFTVVKEKHSSSLQCIINRVGCIWYTHCVCIYLYTQKKVNRGVMYVHTEALYFFSIFYSDEYRGRKRKKERKKRVKVCFLMEYWCPDAVKKRDRFTRRPARRFISYLREKLAHTPPSPPLLYRAGPGYQTRAPEKQPTDRLSVCSCTIAIYTH